MSRTFTDDELLTWEAYPSGSRRGFAERPAIVFRCVTDRAARPRFIESAGDVADAERLVNSLPVADLQALLARSAPLP